MKTFFSILIFFAAVSFARAQTTPMLFDATTGELKRPTAALFLSGNPTIGGAGTYQPLDSDLTAIAALSTTSFGRSLLAGADAAALRALLGTVIGTNVQAYDADLTTWAGVTPSANAQSLNAAANYAAMKTLLTINNVDNTADTAKPVSSAQQTALDGKANLTGGNTITGVQILPGSFIRTPEVITITEASPDTGTINVAIGDGTATIDEATTFTFSAVGTNGQTITRSFANSTGAAVVSTLTGCTPSSTTIAAGATQEYRFKSNGSAWVMPGGDPYAALPIASGGTGATSAATAATALGLGTGDSPQFTAVNVGAATDTTITRVSAGVVAVEGNTVTTTNAIDTNAELRAITVGLGAVVQANSSTFAAPDTTTPRTLTAADCYGFILYYGATGTINLPAGVTGMNGLIYNTGAFTITIDPNGSEVVVRDGAAQTGGVSFTLSSGAGNYVAIHFDGSRWVTLGYKGTLAVGS